MMSTITHKPISMRHNLFLILLLILQPACRQDDTPSALKFKAYAHNPVLGPGKPGSWDDLFTILPCVVRHNGVFYLFYTGSNVNGNYAIGLATSADGYHFTKYGKNPVFESDHKGLDAYGAGSAVVLRNGKTWEMYYSGLDMPGYGPGRSICRATSAALTGPWEKSEKPVLAAGSNGEWDACCLSPSSLIMLGNGSFMMFYTGGTDISAFDGKIGLATSTDGIIWKKYNDPATKQHPFLESDPVLIKGGENDWDGVEAVLCWVSKTHDGFEMYYTGGRLVKNTEQGSFGYAVSNDGIHWEKHEENPVYGIKNDPFARSMEPAGITIEYPSLVFPGTTCFMYYDYGTLSGQIGLAIAPVR